MCDWLAYSISKDVNMSQETTGLNEFWWTYVPVWKLGVGVFESAGRKWIHRPAAERAFVSMRMLFVQKMFICFLL